MKNLLTVLSVFISSICLFNERTLTSELSSQEDPPLHTYCIHLKVKDEKGKYFTSKELREKIVIKIIEVDPKPHETIRFGGIGDKNYKLNRLSNLEMSQDENENAGFVSLYVLQKRRISENRLDYLKKREISIQVNQKTMNLIFKNIRSRTFFTCKAYSIESPIFDEGKYEIDLSNNSIGDDEKPITKISSDKWIKLVTISR
jgi:hypothetical protein